MPLEMLYADRGLAAEGMWHPQSQVGNYFLPPFQRPLVWEEWRMVRFVESALLGLHLGTIVVNDTMSVPCVGGKFHRTDRWLIDGQQRLTAIARYTQGHLTVFRGTPQEHSWAVLSEVERRTFANVTIGVGRVNITDEGTLRDLYDRLNFGGVGHTEDQRASR